MSAVGAGNVGSGGSVRQGLFLLLLYDKAIACLQEAIELLYAGLVAKSSLIRAQDIVMELWTRSKGAREKSPAIRSESICTFTGFDKQCAPGSRRHRRGQGPDGKAQQCLAIDNLGWDSVAVPHVQMAQCPTGRRIGRSKGSSPLILPVLDARRGERLSSAISAEEETTTGSK